MELSARRGLVRQWVVVTALGWAMGGLLAGARGRLAPSPTINGALIGRCGWKMLR